MATGPSHPSGGSDSDAPAAAGSPPSVNTTAIDATTPM